MLLLLLLFFFFGCWNGKFWQDIAYTMPTANAQSWTDISATQLYEIIMVCLNTTYFTENWKYCSKIIFKCVKSAVRPIFNENFVKKRGFWVPWTVHGTHWKSTLLADTFFSKKINKKERKIQTLGIKSSIQMGIKTYLDWEFKYY